MENDNEFNALIALLEDPDQEVYSHVFEKLRSFGTDIIPNQENAWEDCMDPSIQKRLEELIHKIQFEHIEADFVEWCKDETVDLLKGALIINRFQYPEILALSKGFAFPFLFIDIGALYSGFVQSAAVIPRVSAPKHRKTRFAFRPRLQRLANGNCNTGNAIHSKRSHHS